MNKGRFTITNSTYKGVSVLLPYEDNFIFNKYNLLNYETNGGVNDTSLLTSVLDGPPLMLSFDNLTINQGHIFRPTLRCKGLYIYIKGTLTLNGSISMTQRGCRAEGKNIVINPKNKHVMYFDKDIELLDIPTNRFIAAYGGKGGASVVIKNTTRVANHGASSDISSGGGGSGAAWHTDSGSCTSGAGSQGTSFSGGSGGGGASAWNVTRVATDGQPDGGTGGNGVAYDATSGHERYGGPGIGNDSGKYAYGTTSQKTWGWTPVHGTGGSIILIVDGNIIIGSNGKIEANGAGSVNAYPPSTNHRSIPGGTSGGGNISIYTKSSSVESILNTNITKITANGGNDTCSYSIANSVGKGGSGLVRVVKY